MGEIDRVQPVPPARIHPHLSERDRRPSREGFSERRSDSEGAPEDRLELHDPDEELQEEELNPSPPDPSSGEGKEDGPEEGSRLDLAV